ncbi:MAG: amidohydrolase [Armatimonadetes bacterium]|nr:amidohydrolase [Armatimonadota bacterium]
MTTIPDSQASKGLRERLKAEIDRIPAYDSHEHFPSESEYLATHLDFSHAVSMLVLDLYGCGMLRDQIARFTSSDISEEEKWSLFEPHLSKLVNTGLYAGMLRVIRDLYGISDLDCSTYRKLGDRIRAAQHLGRYAMIMDGATVSISVVDSHSITPASNPYDPARFGAVYRIDGWIFGSKYKELDIATVAEAHRAVDDCVESLFRVGVSGIKIAAAAGGRYLSFRRWSEEAVSESFRALVGTETDSPPLSDAAYPFTDSVVFRFVERAAEHGMIVQIHTGWQSYAAGNPYYLKDLIDQCPSATFDIFHAAYPFSGELSMLAKCFPNVYADLSWVAWLSRPLAKQILSDWLELVPNTKIIAFGGDCGFIDMLYGYNRICRDVILDVLEDKVLAGAFGEEESVMIAQRILAGNLKDLLES